MTISNSVLDIIGNTPMIRLHRVVNAAAPRILAKLEFMNPGGSIKDRAAVAMIEDAERIGQLKPGATIIEPTIGNMGIGLALVAAVKGYRLICVMPDKASAEKIALLEAYGAEVIIVPTVPDSSDANYRAVAKRLAMEIPDSYFPDQFSNAANPRCHFNTTGKEIWDQTDGTIDVLVGGCGSGGSITGIGRYLKERNPNICVVGADPDGSMLSGNSCKSYKVEGIGQSFVPSALDLDVIDRWITVSDLDAFMMARRITQEEGLIVGGSSGLVLVAALQVAQYLDDTKSIVVLFPDTGRNYLSKFYSDDWMKCNGLEVSDG